MNKILSSIAISVLLLSSCTSQPEKPVRHVSEGSAAENGAPRKQTGIESDAQFPYGNVKSVDFTDSNSVTIVTTTESELSGYRINKDWVFEEKGTWWAVRPTAQGGLANYTAPSKEALLAAIETKKGIPFFDGQHSVFDTTAQLAEAFSRYDIANGVFLLNGGPGTYYESKLPYLPHNQMGEISISFGSEKQGYKRIKSMCGPKNDPVNNSWLTTRTIAPRYNSGCATIYRYQCASEVSSSDVN